MLVNISLLLAGFAILITGADLLIKGASHLASYLGVSTLLIGLTVVAFGTSAPELFVSAQGALKGNSDIALGNVIGSNIFNLLVIIGLASLMTNLKVPKKIVKFDYPYMIFAFLFLFLFSVNGTITRLEGGVLFLLIFVFLFYCYKTMDLENDVNEKKEINFIKEFSFIVVGLLGMIFGSNWIVSNGTVIAQSLGVSDLVISICLLAVGTSLPELATTYVAVKNDESDLILGNAIGSNIFNVFSVIGITALIFPLNVNMQAVKFDMPLILIASFLVLLSILVFKKVTKITGVLMLLSYVVYIYNII